MPSFERGLRDLFSVLPSPRRIVLSAAAVLAVLAFGAGLAAWRLDVVARTPSGELQEPVVASGVLVTRPYPMLITQGPPGDPAATLLLDDLALPVPPGSAGGEVRVEGVRSPGTRHATIRVRRLDLMGPAPVGSFESMVGGEPVVLRGRLAALVDAETSTQPPLLVSRDASGTTSYYVLASPDGGPLSPEMLEQLTGEVEVGGAVERVGDLRILRVDPAAIRGL